MQGEKSPAVFATSSAVYLVDPLINEKRHLQLKLEVPSTITRQMTTVLLYYFKKV